MEHSTTAHNGQTGRAAMCSAEAARCLADEAAQGGWSPMGMDTLFDSEAEAEAFYQRLRTARH